MVERSAKSRQSVVSSSKQNFAGSQVLLRALTKWSIVVVRDLSGPRVSLFVCSKKLASQHVSFFCFDFQKKQIGKRIFLFSRFCPFSSYRSEFFVESDTNFVWLSSNVCDFGRERERERERISKNKNRSKFFFPAEMAPKIVKITTFKPQPTLYDTFQNSMPSAFLVKRHF